MASGDKEDEADDFQKKKKIPTKNSFHLDPLNPLFFSPAWDTVSTGWTTLDQAWEL